MSLTFGSITLRHGLMLGPMAGYTDLAMRLCCREKGAEYTVTEMISAKAVCYGYKKSTLPAVLSAVPLERIVLETDSPYLAPVPQRGKRNESSYIPHIATFLANIYGCAVEDVAAITSANARKLFPKISDL